MFTSKLISAPPRVSPSTTQDFYNISPTTQRHCRDIWVAKSKTSPKISYFSSPSPKFKPNPHPNTSSIETTNSAFTIVNLPSKLQYLVQQEINRASDPYINPLIKINAVLDTTTEKMPEYKQLMKGSYGKNGINSWSKEFARLAQGHKKYNTKGTNTLFCIHPNQLWKKNKPTYLRICVKFWPQKQYPYRVWFTVVVNLINYQGGTHKSTSDLTTSKLLLNSVISANGARFIFIDLSNFYLIAPFNNKSDYEYVCIPEWLIPEEIMEEYNIKPLIQNGSVLSECITCI